MQVINADNLSRKDFTEAFKGLVKAIKDTRELLNTETREANEATKKEVEQALDKALIKLDDAENKLIGMFNQHVKEMQSDARTTLRMIEQRLDAIQAEIPTEFDDITLREMIESVRKEIPEMPEAFDASEIMSEIEELEKEVQELKKRPVVTGGGVTNARIQQAFKYILKTEQPVGDIDGANKTYTLSQPIFAILSISINGEVIAELPNYTINGKNFKFSTALPAAYSGKDWEVKYI